MIRHGRVAVGAVQLQNAAEPTGADQVLERDVLGVVAAHEAHLHQGPPQGRLLLHQLVRRRDVGRERLLAQHRLARVQAGGHLLEVGAPRCRQQNRVDLGVVDGGDRVGHHPGPDPRGHLLGLRRHEVVDHGDGGAPDRGGEQIDVEGAHHAETENGDTQVAHATGSWVLVLRMDLTVDLSAVSGKRCGRWDRVGCRAGGDEGARARAAGDQATATKTGQGLPQGRSGDAEPATQECLRFQPLTGTQSPVDDRLTDALLDLGPQRHRTAPVQRGPEVGRELGCHSLSVGARG